jgi:hypothetical protein
VRWALLPVPLFGCGGLGEEPSEERLPDLHLEVEARFETEVALGSETIPLTQFQSLAVDPTGRIFIAQPLSGHVLVLSRDGEAERIMGRRGDGPGEFGDVRRVGLTGDATVWVSDPAAGRVTFFDSEGELDSTRRIPDAPPGSRSPLDALSAWPDGSMLLMHRSLSGPQGPRQDHLSVYGLAPGDPDLHLLGRTSTRGRMLSLVSERGVGAIVSRQPVITSTVVAPLDPQPAVLFVPPGGPEGDSVRMVAISLQGDTLMEVAYGREALPVSDSLRQDRSDHFLERVTERDFYSSRSRARTAVSEALVIPTFWPAAQEVVPSGRPEEIWLRIAQDDAGREVYERVRIPEDGGSPDVRRHVAPPGVNIMWGGDRPMGRLVDDWDRHILVRLSPRSSK